MSKSRKIAGTVSDPTLPKTPIAIKGQSYNLCFDMGALADAELRINRELAAGGASEPVNLLMALPILNLFNTRVIFACAIRTFHPDISFQSAVKMIEFDSLWDVATAVRSAWSAATPDPGKAADPPQPGE